VDTADQYPSEHLMLTQGSHQISWPKASQQKFHMVTPELKLHFEMLRQGAVYH